MTEITREMALLRESCKSVIKLLEDPQPGLMMWNSLLRNACIDTQSNLCSLGCTPEACGIEIETKTDA